MYLHWIQPFFNRELRRLISDLSFGLIRRHGETPDCIDDRRDMFVMRAHSFFQFGQLFRQFVMLGEVAPHSNEGANDEHKYFVRPFTPQNSREGRRSVFGEHVGKILSMMATPTL